ncbi:DUF632 domain-containing protein/DUF630 domain-containing protein [Cephalotus follicularis]|uniref:DUF632 domain-containing protein/DUF630 domain-containing protein n=1 Tax=Cephalotus follicularis TaxID=3775 RepID=A0A1Q3C9R4_CEPFO|nr:DUF632 domain-containing protein/DUF630 domain-containing protein [Cephalotus follicularis]
MGCTNSKLDDLPAVALCRDRCSFLDEAIRHRFALAEAHLAYTHSLKQIGHSLHRFIDQGATTTTTARANPGGPTPVLNLPPHKKGDHHDDEDEMQAIKHHGHSNSGSHLQFISDSDDSGHSSPLHHYQHQNFDGDHNDETLGYGVGGGGYMHMNYMKNKAAIPSVVYEQRPVSPDTAYQTSTSSSSYYPYPNTMDYTPYPYPYQGYPPNPDYGGYAGVGGGSMSNFYGSSSSAQAVAAPTSSKPPPPPPSPPRASAWDFLNLFEGNDKYYLSYTPSRDSKELREEEGIPELEDEEYYNHHGRQQKQQQQEVVKEVDIGLKKQFNKSEEVDSKVNHIEVASSSSNSSMYRHSGGLAAENDGVEYDVHVVDKKVVGDNSGFKAGSRDASDVANEIEIQFVRASDSGNEIAALLEVGKLQYQRKNVSRMLHVVTPSLSVVSSQPSTSKSAEPSSSTDKAGLAHLDIVDEDLVTRTRNLSSTLHKLYLWEKKLYNEVKAEEKMRVIHDRKTRKLKSLDERGAEAHKVDVTRTLIRSLSTKIRIAIQVVDKISVTINKIRDEELWPQLNDLIQGLTRMWKSMLECHHNQCLAVKEAKGFGSIGSEGKLSDAHLEATLQLEHELLNWTLRFSSWIGAQKGYVRALNSWLLKCLLYEPEETPDGIVPFSPGRIGAPPVFVICNQWSQALDRISEKEVIDSMRIFSMSVLQLWEHDKLEMRQRMMANKDLERKVKNLDREDQKIQKEIQALDKKLVLFSGDGNSLSVPGHIIYQSDTSSISLQGSLQCIFEALERFTADSMKAYEELVQRSEEERAA